MLGRAPIVDFDGTLTRLDVPWDELRSALAVARIDDLWARGDAGVWEIVGEAEVRAARSAEPLEPVYDELVGVDAFAVLTSNSAEAVRTFVRRFDDLAKRLVIVVGREALGGPKSDFATFASGFVTCVSETIPARADGDVVYAGDMAYELDFARRLGARPIRVDPESGELDDVVRS
jgi:hypothetical protein